MRQSHPDADDGGISLPPGFRAFVAADNLVVGRKVGNTPERLRFLAVAPNGDVYAKLVRGNLLALRDTDGDGRFDLIKEFGPGDGGTHLMFHDGYLYHSSRTAVYRYKYTPGELVPTSPLETIVKDLPAEKDHDAKSFGFDDRGRMIVEVGSPYNVYSDGDRRKGARHVGMLVDPAHTGNVVDSNGGCEPTAPRVTQGCSHCPQDSTTYSRSSHPRHNPPCIARPARSCRRRRRSLSH